MSVLWKSCWGWSSLLGVLLPPLVQIRENPELHDLIQRDKRTWPRCLLWYSSLIAWDGLHLAGSWAVGPGRVAANVLDSRLGGYVPYTMGSWAYTEALVAGTLSGALSANPDVWTDGSLVRDEASGACCGVRVFMLWLRGRRGFMGFGAFGFVTA